MRVCPRCSMNLLEDNDILNDLSHTHNGVKICNPCGNDETLVLAGLGDVDAKVRQLKWENWRA